MTILFGLVPQILQASLINDTFSTWLGVEDSNLNLICLGAGLWLARHSPGNCSIHFLQQNSAVENAHLRRLTKVTKLQLRRRGMVKKNAIGSYPAHPCPPSPSKPPFLERSVPNGGSSPSVSFFFCLKTPTFCVVPIFPYPSPILFESEVIERTQFHF